MKLKHKEPEKILNTLLTKLYYRANSPASYGELERLVLTARGWKTNGQRQNI